MTLIYLAPFESIEATKCFTEAIKASKYMKTLKDNKRKRQIIDKSRKGKSEQMGLELLFKGFYIVHRSKGPMGDSSKV